MRQFEFTPGYYEWHLTDKATSEIVLNIPDPVEDLYNEDGKELGKEEIIDMYENDVEHYNNLYKDGIAVYGVRPEQPLTDEELKPAAHLIAETLYNYYIA